MRHLFHDRNIRLICEPAPREAEVMVDRTCIGHVLINLLTNAAKYAPVGGEVRLSCREDGAAMRFFVEDNGPGISPDHLPHIFEKFFRAPLPGAPPGAGLGLAIAREIVQAHGGTIEVHNNRPAGAVFSFTLPASSAYESRGELEQAVIG
jgi:two-component system sensor histidine kinase KdpD